MTRQTHQQWLEARLDAYARFVGVVGAAIRGVERTALSADAAEWVQAVHEAEVTLNEALAADRIEVSGDISWRCAQCGLPAGQRCPDCKEPPTNA